MIWNDGGLISHQFVIKMVMKFDLYQSIIAKVVNDTVLLPDDVIDVNGKRRQSTATFVSVVTVAEVTWSNWSVTSSGEDVLPGDIVVEVSGSRLPIKTCLCCEKVEFCAKDQIQVRRIWSKFTPVG